jgi:hypothetical protein
VSKEQCSPEAFEEGFGPLVQILEDIAIDEPKALNMMALMMKSVSFDSENCTHRGQGVGSRQASCITLIDLSATYDWLQCCLIAPSISLVPTHVACK